MTITATGPDGYQFNFPDETPSDVVSSTIRKHYGTDTDQAEAPTSSKQTVKEVIRGIPGGAAISDRLPAALQAAVSPLWSSGQPGSSFGERYRKDLSAEQELTRAYEEAHPVRSAIEQGVGGVGTYALAPEIEGATAGTNLIARGLGMAGRAREAIPLAGLSGAGIGALDAYTRGESPMEGAVTGGLGSMGGTVVGHGLGKVWDAARNLWVDRPRGGYSLSTIGGREIPVSEATLTRDPNVMAEEQTALAANHQVATDLERRQKDALSATHADVSAHLDPSGRSQAMTSSEVGSAAVNDLVQQEQVRAQAEQNAILGVQGQTAQLRQQFGTGVAPAATADVGQSIGDRIRSLYRAARARTTQLYNAAAAIPAAYNPYFLHGAGNVIRDAVNSIPDVVRVDAENTPAANRVLQGIDNIIQANLANAATRGGEFTPADLEQIRKYIGRQQRMAVTAARQTGDYEDVRAIGRVRDAYDDWAEHITQTPGGLIHGDPQAVLDAQQAARASHAQERATFGRRGPGDVRGTFMGSVIGKFPDQEMSPEKLISQVMGTTPGGRAPENAVPILNHLRDNVLGAGSQDWRDLKSALVSHLESTKPGEGPIAPDVLANRIEGFLRNARHANAILEPGEIAQLQGVANHARTVAARLGAPPTNTIEHWIGQLSGRGGKMRASGEELMADLLRAGGGDLAQALHQRLPRETMELIKGAMFRKFAGAQPLGRAWENQRINTQLANLLNNPMSSRLFNPSDIERIQNLANIHGDLVPLPRTTNPAGTAATLMRMAKGMKSHVLRGVGLAAGGLHGAIAGHVASEAGSRISSKLEESRLRDLFLGRKAVMPRQGEYYPPRFGSLAGHGLFRNEGSGQ